MGGPRTKAHSCCARDGVSGNGLYWCAHVTKVQAVHCPLCSQMSQSQSRTWCVTDRWCDVDHHVGTVGWTLVAGRERNSRQANLPHFLNGNFTEVAELQTFMTNIRWRRRQHTRTRSTFSTKHSASLSIDVSWGRRRPLSRHRRDKTEWK